MIEFFTYLACVILAGVAVFQLALVFGAPIGRFAWGGQQNVLSAKLRVGSVVAIVLYALFAAFILDKSGMVNVIADDSVVAVGMWVITGYFALGVLMNGISRSKPERALMTPVTAVLTAAFLVVALK